MKILFLSFIILISTQSFAQTDSPKPQKNESNIEAFYFHNTRRCTTCKAVESVSTEAFKALNIKLKSLNIEDDENKAKAEKVGATGQALIVWNGIKSIDLTNDAFMYARSNPDKLKDKIQKAVKQLDQ